MSDTTSFTFTFTDTPTLESAWEDFCTSRGIDFTDAASAETNGVQYIKDQFVGVVALYRANVAAEAERDSTYTTESGDLSGL